MKPEDDLYGFVKLRLMAATLAMALTTIAATSRADCGSSPSGTLTYDNGVMYYCAVSHWVSIKRSSIAGCSAGDAGKLRYLSSQHQFCDGTSWYGTYSATAGAGCTASEAGLTRYSSNKYQGCNGSNWYDLITSAAATITYAGFGASTDNTDTFSYPGVSLGTAAFDRVILVGIAGRSASTRTLTSVTVAGVAATELLDYNVSTSNCGFYAVAIPTGTSGTIDVVFSGQMVRAGVVVWAIRNLHSLTPVHTRTGTATGNLNVQQDGVAAGTYYNSSTANQTWTGLTKDVQYSLVDNIDGNGGGASAVTTVTETRTVSVTVGTSSAPAYCSISLR